MTSRTVTPVAASANHLLDGDVIWFTRPGWSLRLEDAVIALTADDAQALLAAARADPAGTVGVELVELDLSGAAPRPAAFRDRIRATGPTTETQAPRGRQVPLFRV